MSSDPAVVSSYFSGWSSDEPSSKPSSSTSTKGVKAAQDTKKKLQTQTLPMASTPAATAAKKPTTTLSRMNATSKFVTATSTAKTPASTSSPLLKPSAIPVATTRAKAPAKADVSPVPSPTASAAPAVPIMSTKTVVLPPAEGEEESASKAEVTQNVCFDHIARMLRVATEGMDVVVRKGLDALKEGVADVVKVTKDMHAETTKLTAVLSKLAQHDDAKLASQFKQTGQALTKLITETNQSIAGMAQASDKRMAQLIAAVNGKEEESKTKSKKRERTDTEDDAIQDLGRLTQRKQQKKEEHDQSQTPASQEHKDENEEDEEVDSFAQMTSGGIVEREHNDDDEEEEPNMH